MPEARSLIHQSCWRCVGCGKWSHAQRRPQRHRRFAGIEDFLPPELEPFIAERSWSRERDTGAPVSAVWVWCGPFERYEARYADDREPKPLDPDRLPPVKDEDYYDGPIAKVDDVELPF